MAVRVVISPAAAADIEAITAFIAEANPDAARRFYRRLRERCNSLSDFPNRGRRYDNRFRMLVEGNYLIFYRVEKTGSDLSVVISIVVHAARDVASLLEGR